MPQNQPIVIDPADIDEVPEDQLIIKKASPAKASNPNKIPPGAPKADVYTPKSIMRGAVIGAAEGAGIKPSTDPAEVVAGSIRQAGQGITDLAKTSFEHNRHDLDQIPGLKSLPDWAKNIVATPLAAFDIPATFLDNAANSIEGGFREASAAMKRGDQEAAAEATASTLAQIALLRKVKDSAGALEDAKKASLADKAQGAARKLTEAKQAAHDAVTKAVRQYSDELEKNRAARKATIADNLERTRSARTKIDQGKLSVAEENRGIEAENKTQAEAVAKRGQMAKEVDHDSVSLGTDLKKLEHDVWREANRRMDEVKPRGNPQSAPDALIATVKGAETDILQGIPERIKEFNHILGMEGPPAELAGAIEEYYGWTPEGNEPLTWEKLQSLKSRIDARLRSPRGMNGDVKRALFSVRDGVVDEMGNMLEQPGQPPEAVKNWQAARQYYREFREDFHEPTGPSSSGSPVAKALDAVDPDKIRKPFSNVQSAIGNRGLDTLRKYQQFGGEKIAEKAQAVLAKEKEMEGLPDKAKPKPLKQAPEVHELPKRKPAAPIPGKPTVNLDQAARDRIAQTAQRVGRLNVWDARILASSAIAGVLAPFIGVKGGVELGASYVAMKYYLSSALEKPKVIDWIARTPQSELEALKKLPGAEKINIQHGLTEAAIESAKGKKIKVSPELRSFLGPNNVKRLIAAGVVNKGAQEKKPAEQLKDLKAIQQRSSNPNLPGGEAEP